MISAGILLSLIPLVGWGLGDYIASRLSKYRPAVVSFAWSSIFLVYACGLVVIFGFDMPSLKTALIHVGAALLLNGGFIAMLYAFNKGAVGVVSPIANAYGVITAAGSAIFLGVRISALGWLAVGAVTAGISMMSYKKDPPDGDPMNSKNVIASVAYSIAALTAFGIGFMLFDVATKDQQWHQGFIVFSSMSFLVSLVILLLTVRENKTVQLRGIYRTRRLYAGALVSGSGTVGLFAAIGAVGNATIPAVISAASPLVTSFLAYYLDKEYLSLLQRAGAVVIVAGIMLLSL